MDKNETLRVTVLIAESARALVLVALALAVAEQSGWDVTVYGPRVVDLLALL